MTKKILFISHDDTRTGAPILLLNLRKAILANAPSIKVDFLLKNCYGQLLSRFSEVGETFVLNKLEKESLYKRVLKKISSNSNDAVWENKLKKLNLNSYDLILSNTITNGDILPIVRKYYKGIIVSYIHELFMASTFFTNNKLISELIVSSDFFAYPSDAVKIFLESNYAIPNEKFFYLPYYIPQKEIIPENKVACVKNAFVVGGCGTIDWRKGFDLFIQLALLMKDKQLENKIKLVWKGASPGLDLQRANYDIEKAGISDLMEIQMSANDMSTFWESLDLFVLTSREDPFPLVVLEAARYKIPTVAFQNTGGATEFISDDAGILVPYLSINRMADSIIDLISENKKKENLGNVAFGKMQNLYSDSNSVFGYFKKILNITFLNAAKQ